MSGGEDLLGFTQWRMYSQAPYWYYDLVLSKEGDRPTSLVRLKGDEMKQFYRHRIWHQTQRIWMMEGDERLQGLSYIDELLSSTSYRALKLCRLNRDEFIYYLLKDDDGDSLNECIELVR